MGKVKEFYMSLYESIWGPDAYDFIEPDPITFSEKQIKAVIRSINRSNGLVYNLEVFDRNVLIAAVKYAENCAKKYQLPTEYNRFTEVWVYDKILEYLGVSRHEL